MRIRTRLDRLEERHGGRPTDYWFLSPASGRLIHVVPGGGDAEYDEAFLRQHPDAVIVRFNLREADGTPPVVVDFPGDDE